MSSLRQDSLRLCWIEAFVAVVDEENISEAAKKLGITQPTVSRYIQWLEHWLGKKLIQPAGIRDRDHPRLSVAVTEDGQQFYLIAMSTIDALVGFRTMAAQCQEQVASMEAMSKKMRTDLVSSSPSRASRKRIEMVKAFELLSSSFSETHPLESLIVLNKRMRSDFSDYEAERKREAKLKPKRIPKSIETKTLTI